MYIYCVHAWYPQRSEEGAERAGAAVTEAVSAVWVLEPLLGQQVVLTTELPQQFPALSCEYSLLGLALRDSESLSILLFALGKGLESRWQATALGFIFFQSS